MAQPVTQADHQPHEPFRETYGVVAAVGGSLVIRSQGTPLRAAPWEWRVVLHSHGWPSALARLGNQPFERKPPCGRLRPHWHSGLQ